VSANSDKKPEFKGKPDLETLQQLIRFIDKTPAVTWTGQGGVKSRILEVIEEHTPKEEESTDER